MIKNFFFKHYKYKVLTNFIKIPISFILQSIIPRLLGPVSYGNYEFLNDLSNRIISFFESGNLMAFISKFNQNINNKKIIKYYSILYFIISLIYISIVSALIYFGYSQKIWVNQDSYLIILSVLLGILINLSSFIIRLIDSYHLTVEGEKMRIFQLLLSTIFIVIIYLFFSRISIYIFYFIQIIIFISLIFGGLFIIRKTNFFESFKINLRKIDFYYHNKYFFKYSHPIITFSLITLIIGFLERWMLQSFGGSLETGYFAISFKVGALIFIFTSAAIELLNREFSFLYGKRKIIELSNLFIQNFKVLYLLASFLSVLVLYNTELIIKIIGGDEFRAAGSVLQILCLYPIHQTIGQLNGTLFYSTNRTNQYRNVGVISMICFFPLSFILLAPNTYGGFNLGAVGLISYMIIYQLFSTNINLYYNCKFLKIKYLKLFVYQITILFGIILLAFFTNLFVSEIIIHNSFTYLFLKAFLSTLIICIFVFVLIYKYPSLFGINNFLNNLKK